MVHGLQVLRKESRFLRLSVSWFVGWFVCLFVYLVFVWYFARWRVCLFGCSLFYEVALPQIAMEVQLGRHGYVLGTVDISRAAFSVSFCWSTARLADKVVVLQAALEGHRVCGHCCVGVALKSPLVTAHTARRWYKSVSETVASAWRLTRAVLMGLGLGSGLVMLVSYTRQCASTIFSKTKWTAKVTTSKKHMKWGYWHKLAHFSTHCMMRSDSSRRGEKKVGKSSRDEKCKARTVVVRGGKIQLYMERDTGSKVCLGGSEEG